MPEQFQSFVDAEFPGAMPADAYHAALRSALAPHGFTPDTTIACVGVCRDELCRGFVDGVEAEWGRAFNFSSLAGMLFLGTTGFQAAHAHAPIVDGRERYLYVAGPHLGVGPGGEIGMCRRLGRERASVACGALAALLEDLRKGHPETRHVADDLEQSLLADMLLHRLRWGDVPDLVELTRLALTEIEATLQRMIELTVDTARADYAISTLIQIHGPEGDVVWPATSRAVVGGEDVALELTAG